MLYVVQLWDLITDDLTRFDVQEALDTDEFFVFDELLDEIMLAFTRDSEIPQLCSLPVSTAVLKAIPSSKRSIQI